MIHDDHRPVEVEEENYFISMTDMMVGLVFIFIILLMYFALQFQDVTDQLTGADRTRTRILETLQASLKEKGVDVTIDTQNGVLRLPDAILFDSGQADLKPSGRVAVQHLATALSEVLPCYTESLQAAGSRPAHCPATPHRVESLFIEGHTDTDPLSGRGLMRDNWDLSVVRATNTYRALAGDSPELAGLCVRKRDRCEPVLSVSGYGPQRPLDPGASEEQKRRNRRIDLRIIMTAPDGGETAGKIATALERP